MTENSRIAKIERLQDNAKLSFYAASFFSAFGIVCAWKTASLINLHSVGGLIAALSLLFFTIATAAAGVAGLFFAGLLFCRQKTVSWHGVAASLMATLFWMIARW